MVVKKAFMNSIQNFSFHTSERLKNVQRGQKMVDTSKTFLCKYCKHTPSKLQLRAVVPNLFEPTGTFESL